MILPRARHFALSAAALLIPQIVRAQQVTSRVEAGGLITDAGGQAAIPTSIFRVAPAVSIKGTRGMLSARSGAWYESQQWQLADGSIGGTLVAPTIYGVRAELIGNASRAFDDRSMGADQIDVGTRINFAFTRNFGAWVGGGVARPWRVNVISTVDLVDAGAWWDIGEGNLTFTSTTFSLNKASTNDEHVAFTCETPASLLANKADGAGGPPAPCSHRSNVTDFTLAGRWNLDRFELSGEVGHRAGRTSDVASDSKYWSSGTMTMWVAPRAAIVAGGGRQPSNPARGIPGRIFGTIGMMLAYSPARYSVPVAELNAARISVFEAKPAAQGMQKILVRVARVETVEVMGDFSDWAPVSMTRRGRDMWEVSLPLTPGRHQINIRTDGGKWVAPPGLPKSTDNFSGEVGILIVK